MGYGGLPKTQQEREIDLEMRASDREREMGHVFDAAPGQDRGPSLFDRIVRALRRRQHRSRF
jgi:hypothetical protein